MPIRFQCRYHIIYHTTPQAYTKLIPFLELFVGVMEAGGDSKDEVIHSLLGTRRTWELEMALIGTPASQLVDCITEGVHEVGKATPSP